MADSQEASDAQLCRVYLACRAVRAMAPDGGLVMLAAQGVYTALHAAGARVAGCAVLLLTTEPDAAKNAVRAGWCDYLVTSLDEAVRILKLSLRRGAGVGVVLRAEPELVLKECVERGVQPALLDLDVGLDVAALCDRGARTIVWPHALNTAEQWMLWHGLSGSPALAAADVAAQECLLERKGEKEHWLKLAPHALGRAGAATRVLPMTPAERAAFAAHPGAQGVFLRCGL